MSTIAQEPRSAAAQCLIDAGLQDRILLPGTDAYPDRINSYFCNSAKLNPACILQPKSALQVAIAVEALAASKQKFAIRSGGHMNWTGCNNIGKTGVTIDLGLLNRTQFNAATGTAEIGSGARWETVYEELEKYGRVVAGAREPNVGVGGFLLGGGNTFYGQLHGLDCDNVVAYEVVLANGNIVMATKDAHPDLFQVLKGGGNNFGIVTKFTMATFPSSKLWGGWIISPQSVLPEVPEAIAKFTARSSKHLNSTLGLAVCHNPLAGGDAVFSLCVSVDPVDSYAFTDITALEQIKSNLKESTLAELNSYSSLATNFYNVWNTLCIKTDPTIIAKAIELYNAMEALVKKKIDANDYTSHISFQPIPRTYYKEKGGAIRSNILGMDRFGHDVIAIQAALSVRTQNLADWARPLVQKMVRELRDFAESQPDGLCPWLHLNWAGPEQKVLQSYGIENVEKMRLTAKKYDPNGVFQRLCPGGFKIADVQE
ncbi:hypothetical protein GGR57DRAFT_520571 [Xylariaceae sp. FL1272]|nr:hypothetical protein GGR57DRAFT_520571 [Xylariaceae sp. FL1272]